MQHIWHIGIVGLGGCFGAIARNLLGGWILHQTPNWKLPVGTLVVNVVGCLIAGILTGLIRRYDLFSEEVRIFLFTGLLGGFTTFSAFGVETIKLLLDKHTGAACANVALSVGLGLFALWLGMTAVLATPPSAPA